jgi:cyclic pyranopterin phosphate synthase
VTLSHLGPDGSARMVDVGAKAGTRRRAVAEGQVRMSAEAFAQVRDSTLAKGDVLAVARIAGIQAAKRTAELIPLCHPLPLDHIEVDADLLEELPGVRILATVSVESKTGVEMEALTAVAVACLTVYDMVKAADKGMIIEAVRLVHKSGGRGGEYPVPAGSD